MAGNLAMHYWSYWCSIMGSRDHSLTPLHSRFPPRKAARRKPSFGNIYWRAGARARRRKQSHRQCTHLRSPLRHLLGGTGYPVKTRSISWLKQVSISSLRNRYEQSSSSTGVSAADHQEKSTVASSNMCAGGGSSTPARCITAPNPRGYLATGNPMRQSMRRCGWQVSKRLMPERCCPNL